MTFFLVTAFACGKVLVQTNSIPGILQKSRNAVFSKNSADRFYMQHSLCILPLSKYIAIIIADYFFNHVSDNLTLRWWFHCAFDPP